MNIRSINKNIIFIYFFFFFVDNKQFAVSILVEYIRSLTDNKITVEHFLYELLINCLVINKMYYQLHQMIQYHIVIDSKPLVI